jgi:tape measure domain-containing protein
MATNLGTLTLNLLANTGSYIQGLSRAERQTHASTKGMADDYNLVGKSIKELQNTIVGSLAGIVSVGAVISKMDAYTGLQNRLKLVTTSQADLNQAMQDTLMIAQASGQSWDSTAQVYQRFADNANRLGISLQDTASLTDTVAKSIAISGGSAASAEAALVQFGQALASGVLRGEEFNSISEQAPGLLKAIATGLNVNIGELRAMANEGQLTADVVIESLNKAKASVDTLFGKTDFTIGMSFTQLNNALTQFIGEAGRGSGAAQLISGSIQGLAANFDTFANAAMVGTAFYAGSYIPTILSSVAAGYSKTKQLVEQAAVQYATMQAERAAAAQGVINTQTVLANTQATLAALATEKALEVERMKAQISSQGRIASGLRMVQLRTIESQVTAELTAAENALAAARARANAIGTVSTGISGGLLTILGGPVGLGLTVAGVAASYLLMHDNADKVNKKLAEQASVADTAASELSKLQGVDRKSAINDLTEAFEAQNKALGKSELAVGSALINIQNYAVGNAEVAKISNEARLGTISYTEAIKRLNGQSISPDLYNALKDQVAKYDENYIKANKSADALKVFNKETVLAGNEAQNAVAKHQSQADAINNTANAADKASEALLNYRNKQKETVFESIYKSGLLDEGYNTAQAQAIYDAQMAKGTSAILSKDDKESALNTLRIQEQYKAREEAEREAEKKAQDAARKRESERKQAADDLVRKTKEQAKQREQIEYGFYSILTQMHADYTERVKAINAAGFGSQTSTYLSMAEQQYKFEEELYLRNLTSEINDHIWSEDQKRKYEYETEVFRYSEGRELDKDLKEVKLKSLKEQFDKANAWAALEREQRMSDAANFLRTDLENMQIKYAFEREKIQENSKISQSERERLIAISKASEDFEKNKNLQSATASWGGTFSEINGTSNTDQLEQDRFGRYDESQALFDAQMALADSAAEREAIWQAHNERMFMIDQQYELDKASLGTKAASDTLSGMTDLMGSLLGEQSAGYKAMFAMSKAFAIAQAIINAPKTFSDVYASVAAIPYVGPYLAPVMAGAAVAVQLAQVSQIKSTNLTGMAHDGIDYVPQEGTWLLNKGERVLSPRQNQDFTRVMAEKRFDSQLNITINNNTNAVVTARQDSNGGVTIDVVDERIARSWENLNRANSYESQAVMDNFGVGRNRGG